MKKGILKSLMMPALLWILVSCSDSKTGETAAVDKEQIKKEIQAREDEFAAVYNSGQLKNIGYYAEDAISYFQNREPLVGKEAIVEFLRGDVTANPNKISFKTNEVYPSRDGSMVLEIGHFTVTDSTNTTLNSGNYMVLFEKRDGKYVCIRDMSASDRPME
ncbi:MAG TPA: nuclear transport factor 2 family protein [Chitinophagaceae bacterium]